MARKKNMNGYLRQAIGDSSVLAANVSTEEIAQRLRVDQLRIMNSQYRQIDFLLAEMQHEGLSLQRMKELQEEYINAGGIITTVRRTVVKRGQRSSGQTVKAETSSFKAKTDSNGSFVWQNGK